MEEHGEGEAGSITPRPNRKTHVGYLGKRKCTTYLEEIREDVIPVIIVTGEPIKGDHGPSTKID
jgi:hypothetical protein